jgi:hypothetical protein
MSHCTFPIQESSGRPKKAPVQMEATRLTNVSIGPETS